MMGLNQCASLFDLCAMQTANVGFFSKGDCQITRSDAFRGHEWITTIGNQQLVSPDRFVDEEIFHIVEGNRRVDFPKELLVHLNAGALPYANALTDYHNEPKNQPMHFLLDARTYTPEAADDAYALLLTITQTAVETFGTDRLRSLTQMGRATHMIQDSFSPAHSCREFDNGGTTCDEAAPTDEGGWCVQQIKAYMPRDKDLRQRDLDEGVSFHGGPLQDPDSDDDDDIEALGHTTPQDSIYVAGRNCRQPDSAAEVIRCLNGPAKRAVCATRDYLAMVHQLARNEDTSRVAHSVECFVSRHMRLCGRPLAACGDVSFSDCGDFDGSPVP